MKQQKKKPSTRVQKISQSRLAVIKLIVVDSKLLRNKNKTKKNCNFQEIQSSEHTSQRP